MLVDESHSPGQNDTNKKFYHVRAIEIEPAGGQLGINSSSSRPDTDSTISIADL